MMTWTRSVSGKLIAFGAVLLLWMLQACGNSGETVAGGEDFPNALADVGDTLNEHFHSLDDWDVLARASAQSRDLTQWEPSEELQPQESAVLMKTTVGEESWSADFSDTANGLLWVMNSTVGALKTSVDTLLVRWDSNARDSVDGNENIVEIRSCENWNSGQSYCFQISDLDGDSLLVFGVGGCSPNVVPELCNTAKASSQWYDSTGNLRIQGYWEVSSGNDGDFDSDSDNALRTMRRIHYLENGDTASAELWQIAEEGKWLYGNGDSVVVDYQKTNYTPTDAAFRQIEFRALYFPKDTLATRFIAFEEEVQFSSGAGLLTTMSFPGAEHAMDAAAVGDSVVIHTLWTGSAGTWVKDLWLNVILDGLMDSDNHYLIGVKAEVRNMDTRYFRSFEFIPGEPLRDGQEPRSGEIKLIETDALGKDLRLNGVWDLDSWNVRIEDKQGREWDAVFTTDGELVSAE